MSRLAQLLSLLVLLPSGCASKPPAQSTIEPMPARDTTLGDAGGQYWVSSARAANGGKPTIALLGIERVTDSNASGTLQTADFALEFRLFHPVEDRTVCSAKPNSECKECALNSREVPTELDCSVDLGTSVEMRRKVATKTIGDGFEVRLQGTTEYDQFNEPIPTVYELHPTSSIRLAWGPLSSRSFANRSSESDILRSSSSSGPDLTRYLKRAERRLASEGYDPSTLPLDAAIRLHDAAKRSKSFGWYPDSPDEPFNRALDAELLRLD